MSDVSFKLFDKILKALSKNYGNELSILDIAKSVYPDYYSGKKEFPMNVTNLDDKHSRDIIDSLNFLDREGYVKFNIPLQKASISTKGLIKTQTSGFDKQYKKEQVNLILQRWTWIILPLAGLITAGFSIANLCLTHF